MTRPHEQIVDWPDAELEMARSRVLPGVVRVPDPGGVSSRRRAFYRHVPVSERRYLAEWAEGFARRVDAAMMLMCFAPLRRDRARLYHLGPVIHVIADNGVVPVREFDPDSPVVTLRSFLSLITEED